MMILWYKYHHAFALAWHWLVTTFPGQIVRMIIPAILLCVTVGSLLMQATWPALSENTWKVPSIVAVVPSQANEQNLDEIRSVLQKTPDLQGFDYISPEQGLSRFQTDSHLSSTVLNSLSISHFPAVFVLRPKCWSASCLSSLTDMLHNTPYHLRVLYDPTSVQERWQWLSLVYEGIKDMGYIAPFLGFLLLFIWMQDTYVRHKCWASVALLQGAYPSDWRRPYLLLALILGIFLGVMAAFIWWFVLYLWTDWVREHLWLLLPLQVPVLNIHDCLSFILIGMISTWFVMRLCLFRRPNIV